MVPAGDHNEGRKWVRDGVAFVQPRDDRGPLTLALSSPRTSMAGTLRSTTNSSLRKLRRARVGDFRFFGASNAARSKGVV
jgi:hypothetical protein